MDNKEIEKNERDIAKKILILDLWVIALFVVSSVVIILLFSSVNRYHPYDINRDGVVNEIDLALLEEYIESQVCDYE